MVVIAELVRNIRKPIKVFQELETSFLVQLSTLSLEQNSFEGISLEFVDEMASTQRISWLDASCCI